METTADGFAAGISHVAKRPRYELLAPTLIARAMDDRCAHPVECGTVCDVDT